MELFEKNYKTITLFIGVLFFSFLIYISWLFYKERVLCFDPAFFAFQIIDTKNFSIALGRWGSVFSQILPLWALKNGCSLETFLRLFSIAPIINYFIIFLIITFGLKNYRAALALMLSLCLGFRHAFYYTTAELYLGIALSIFLWAIIAPEKEYDSKFKKNTALIASLLLICVMSYSHQLTVFLILFVLISETLVNKRYKDVHLWILFVVTIIWYYFKIFIFKSSEYEMEKIPTLAIFIKQLPFINDLSSTYYFKHFAKHYLWILFLTFFISWIYLFKMKNWLYFIFLPAFSLFYLAIILITYYKGESVLMYQNYYTVFGVFAAVSFMYILYSNFKKKWRLFLVLPLLVLNLGGIYKAHAILTKRIEYVDHLVSYGRKQDNKKFLISAQNFQWQIGWISWSLPFETALYSAIEGPDSAVTFFVTDEMNKYDSLINKKNVFFGPEWAITWFGSQNLNRNYFHFPSTGYKKLTTSQADTSFSEEVFNKNNVQIIPVKEKIYCDPDSFVYVPIRIINLSEKALASIPKGDEPIFLSYHVYDIKNKIILPDQGVRTPFDIDIEKEYLQGLLVTLPKKRGNYVIAVDIVTENKRWWGINSKFILVVE
ncbi:MAG: hypothetical protein ACT4ON_13810 [Bacteroidota bacterium]